MDVIKAKLVVVNETWSLLFINRVYIKSIVNIEVRFFSESICLFINGEIGSNWMKTIFAQTSQIII